MGNYPANPGTYTKKERLDLLVKAGALIAAEIDRINRIKKIATPDPILSDEPGGDPIQCCADCDICEEKDDCE